MDAIKYLILGHLWNFIPNFEPIIRKICILFDFNFCVWFTKSLNCDVISLIETAPTSWQRNMVSIVSILRKLHNNTNVCCFRRHDLPSGSPSSKNTALCSQLRLLQSQGLPPSSISRERPFLLRFNTRDQFHVLGSRNQLRRLVLSSRYRRLGIMTTSNDRA